MQLGAKGFGDPLEFSNVYYTELMKKPWEKPNDDMAKMIGLPSDHILPGDPECHPLLAMYAGNQPRFFQDFTSAYIKMTALGARWRTA